MSNFFKDIKLNKQESLKVLMLDNKKKVISSDILIDDVRETIKKTNKTEADLANLKTKFEEDLKDLEIDMEGNYNELVSKIADETSNRESAIDNLTQTITNNYITLNSKIDSTKETIESDINSMEESLNQKITKETSDREEAISDINKSIEDLRESLEGTVEGEITDLKEELKTKLDKIEEANIIYGTDASGNQTSYTMDSFGKVDTVNNIVADSKKNIQLDGTKIYIDDSASTKETIKAGLVRIENLADSVVKAVDFDNTTFIMTFKDNKGNTIKEIDLPLESTVQSGRYDNINKNIVLILQSGDEVKIPVEDLCDVYTGKDGTKIKVTVNNSNVIEATIKSGTIEKTDLNSSLVDEINGKLSASFFSGNKSLYSHTWSIKGVLTNYKIGLAAAPKYNTHVNLSLLGVEPNTGNPFWLDTGFDSSEKVRLVSTSAYSDEGNGANGICFGIDSSGQFITINTHMESAEFDPKTSKLTSRQISPAIRELKGLVDTNTSNITNLTKSVSDIEYDIVNLIEMVEKAGKVDKVNGITPGSDKNIQLDASKIYIDDSVEEKKTIKEEINSLNTTIQSLTSRIDSLEGIVNLMVEKITEINGEIV